MEIARRSVGNVTVLELNGRLAVSAAEAEIVPLDTAIRELVADGQVNIALHLAKLAYLDARGLGELVLLRTMLRRSGGELTLVAPTPAVRRMLAVTRLDRVFALCDSEREFLAHHLAAMPIQC